MLAPIRPRPIMPSCITTPWPMRRRARRRRCRRGCRARRSRTSQPGSSLSTNRSAFFTTPPPITISSGQSTECRCVRYVLSRSAHCSHVRCFSVALRVGGPRVGDLAVHLEVAELGVRDEHAVVEERGADAGADGHHHDHAPAVARGAEARLGDPGRVGVVQHGALPAGRATDHGGGVRADPRLVDVRGGAHRAAHHDRRASVHPIGPVGPELLDERRNRGRHRFGSRGLRCLEPDPARRGPGVEVDERGLDARAADVDTDECLSRRHRVEATPTARRADAGPE